MNNDLISRNLAISYAVSGLVRRIDEEDWIRVSEVKQNINNAPTVSFMISPDYVTELQNHNKELIKQLEEVDRPHAEWIKINSLENGNAQYMCSNCRHGDEHAESQEVPYCWHCGAKMMKEGVKNDT